MSSAHDPIDRPAALQDRAREDLTYIRRAMERAGYFTAVPGWGGVAMGVIGIGAGVASELVDGPGAWLAVWLGAAVLAVGVGSWSIARKARRAGVPLIAGPGRRFVLALTPPLLAGAALTVVLYGNDLISELPGTWLLLYGVGVVTGGAFSVPVVPAMGVGFMGLGILALFTPASLGNLWLAAGFGVLQVVGGLVIARRYGG